MFTDIRQLNWIEALPAMAKPYAYLARLDRPIGWWLLLLPSLWAIALAAGGVFKMNAVDWQLMVLFFVGAIVMRAAGCVINDLWDRKLDQKVERTSQRPLAAGTVSVPQAFVFLAGLLLIGLSILLQMHIVTILLGILSLPLIVAYPLMKRWTWWPQIFLGVVFNFGVLMGWSAMNGVLAIEALVLYLGCMIWTLGYDTIYAHQDKEDDMLIGIKSSALKLGEKSRSWVSGFYAVAALLIAWAGAMAGVGFGFYIVMAFAAAHLGWQMRSWDMNDPENSLQIFRSNRDFGLIVFLAMLVSGL